MMPEHPTCSQTGAAMIRDIRPMALTYKGQTVTVDLPGWYSPLSDDSQHDGPDLKVTDRALNALRARVDGLLGADDIRRIRRRLGLTQRAAGDVLGGGPNAFQKYESGDVLVSQAMSGLLTLLDHDPTALSVLRDRKTAA
jgi:HTH-type transcriptional regulator / antitoxin MqsA